MKNHILAIFTCLLLVACGKPGHHGDSSNDPVNAEQAMENHQDGNEAAKDSKPTAIDIIQGDYQQIVNARNSENLTTSSFLFDCEGEVVGSVTFYSDANGLRLIEKEYTELSDQKTIEQYFVRDGTPFYILYRSSEWDIDTDEGEKETTNEVDEEHYYLQSGQLIACFEKEFEIKSLTQDIPSSDGIPLEKVDCPSLDELMDDFNDLMEYRQQTAAIECL